MTTSPSRADNKRGTWPATSAPGLAPGAARPPPHLRRDCPGSAHLPPTRDFGHPVQDRPAPASRRRQRPSQRQRGRPCQRCIGRGYRCRCGRAAGIERQPPRLHGLERCTHAGAGGCVGRARLRTLSTLGIRNKPGPNVVKSADEQGLFFRIQAPEVVWRRRCNRRNVSVTPASGVADFGPLFRAR